MAQSPTPKSYYEYSSTDDRSSEESAVSLLSRDDLSEAYFSLSAEPEASAAAERTSFLRKYFLSALCFLLHLLLVLIHVAVFISAIKHWEYRFVFSIEHQTTVSFWTTMVTQSFGTKLGIRHILGLNTTLTAAHDCISAWAGLGSALATMLNQVSVPASVLGTLTIVGYLSCISVLHTSIPAILSVEVFNTTVAVPATTSWFPEYANSTVINSTQDYMITFPGRFLQWRGVFDDSQMLGLSNGSLYEVLTNTTSGPGKAQVSALGFNISCGYLSGSLTEIPEWGPEFEIGGNGTPVAEATLNPEYDLFPNVISGIQKIGDSIYMYTTAMVVDSQGHQGSPFIFNQDSLIAFNLTTGLLPNASQIQFLQCFKSLVAQSGMIDTQSNTIAPGSLYPSIQKNNSTWLSAAEVLAPPQTSTLLGSDFWAEILGNANYDTDLTAPYNPVEEYLMSYLGLNPFANVTSVVSLHEIENALSSLLAMFFWTAGHVELDPWYRQYTVAILEDRVQTIEGIVPVLIPGNANLLDQETTHSNLVAVTVGLTSSVIQMILCITVLFPSIQRPGVPSSIGLLYTIWIWRTHKELLSPLRNVQHPTERNLRCAGLIHPQQSTEKYEHRQIESEGSGLLRASSAHFFPTKYASMCILLHIFLVVIFATALLFTVTRQDHTVIFSINIQQNVSFLCKTATTVFGTIYYSLLVYSTQRLTVACSIQKYSLLAATHDQVLAWTGIGSACSALYHQIKWPTSWLQILFIWLYLAAISILHIVTPAIIAVESFNSTTPTKVKTQSFPQWSNGSHNSTLAYLVSGGSFLPWFDDLDQSTKLGMFNGSLYDVLEHAYSGSGPAQISAVGFNITCGYIPNITATIIPLSTADKAQGVCQAYNISADNFYWSQFCQPAPDFLFTANRVFTNAPTDSIILVTQNPVHDSHENLGSPVHLPPSNVTSQFIQCSNSLVSQLGRVDARSRLIIPNSLDPQIHKNTSVWKPYQKISSTVIPDDSSLLEGDSWIQGVLNSFSGLLNIPMGSNSGLETDFLSMNIMQQLGLNPVSASNQNATSQSIVPKELYLHDIENALSNLVTSIFWISGHVNQSTLTMQTQQSVTLGPPYPPTLSTGNATVEEVILAARLDVSLAAVLIGLGASILLLILVFVFSMGSERPNPYLTSMGFLQTIWVVEHHPELSEILEQVEDPADDNLREAGMVTGLSTTLKDIPYQISTQNDALIQIYATFDRHLQRLAWVIWHYSTFLLGQVASHHGQLPKTTNFSNTEVEVFSDELVISGLYPSYLWLGHQFGDVCHFGQFPLF
ncbi:hypothetical protein K438DRAFT_1936834 [Mycena galopus ATCC 62051]|nr:hypothetical protein K438DRAFT_1936834 [Mycena galopus ATCC 62051]